MIYFLAFLISFFFIIYVWNSIYETSGRIILTVLITVLCLFVGFLINGVFLATIIPPTDIGETEVPVYTNPITNQYYLINSKGELIDTDNYEISSKVNEPTGIEKDVKYDMGIWGISTTDTVYRILIPLERE